MNRSGYQSVHHVATVSLQGRRELSGLKEMFKSELIWWVVPYDKSCFDFGRLPGENVRSKKAT